MKPHVWVLTCRIQRINIERQINGRRRPDPVQDFLHNPTRPDLVNLARLNNLEPAVSIVVVVAWP